MPKMSKKTSKMNFIFDLFTYDLCSYAYWKDLKELMLAHMGFVWSTTVEVEVCDQTSRDFGHRGKGYAWSKVPT